MTGLSDEDLGRLCTLEQLKWGVLNGSVGRSLLALRKEVEEQRKEIVELTNLLKRTVRHPEEANASEIIKKIFPQSKQFPPPVKKGTHSFDVPDGVIAPGLPGHLSELIAVVGLRGGSRVTGGLSARGLANVPVGDWSDDFTFIVGDHGYRCPSSVAQFLSPRVSKLHSIDVTISELRLEVEDRGGLFSSVLETAGGGSIAVDSTHRRTFEAICAALRNL
jgi:hypothetical protein